MSRHSRIRIGPLKCSDPELPRRGLLVPDLISEIRCGARVRNASEQQIWQVVPRDRSSRIASGMARRVSHA